MRLVIAVNSHNRFISPILINRYRPNSRYIGNLPSRPAPAGGYNSGAFNRSLPCVASSSLSRPRLAFACRRAYLPRVDLAEAALASPVLVAVAADNPGLAGE